MVRKAFVLGVCIALSTSGCATSGWRKAPEPGLCAVFGAVLGAGAGVVIGNNSGSHSNSKRAWGGAAGLAAGALAGRLLCMGLAREAHPVTVSVSATPTSGDAPLSVDLTASADSPDGEIVSYEWSLGDGTEASGANVQHTYKTPGRYSAKLKVTDNNGLTASASANVQVAEKAAPAPPAPPPVKKRIVLRGVNFAFDSAAIRSEDEPVLEAAVEVLGENPDVRVQIAGHTDSTGPEAYNQILSERRANAVRDFLVQSGLPAAQLVAVGLGESEPVAGNDSRDGRAQNRRVELTVLE